MHEISPTSVYRPAYLLMLLALVFAGGCGTAKLDAAAWQDRQLKGIVWPRPPAAPRVSLVRIINGPLDVSGTEKGLLKRLSEYFVGEDGDQAGFFTPHCMAADGSGLLYVADPSLGVVHRYDLGGKEVSYISQAGSRMLGSPVGLALDPEGNLYVADAQLATVFKFSRRGELLAELDGKGALKRPAGLAITSRGDKIVADMNANKLFVFGKDDVYKGEMPMSGLAGGLSMPTYVAVDRADYLYVTDSLNFTVRVFDPEGKYVRSLGQIGDVPGSFARPKGLALDSYRNLYVIDAIFGNFQIFNQAGELLLYVGQEGNRPGEMMLPSGIYIDGHDRIYVADTFNHRIQIFQLLREEKADVH